MEVEWVWIKGMTFCKFGTVAHLQQTIGLDVREAFQVQFGFIEAMVDELIFILSRGHGKAGYEEKFPEVK